MSIDKFRFVSPGVQVQEIDQSQIPRTAEDMGPVIIGRAARGPVMRPVRVGSFSDFVDIFGEPIAGGGGGDVWRDGNRTAPTYGAYAAQAYLKNSSPVTFIRLAGYANEQAGATVAAGAAGWKTNNAYGLFVVPTVSGALGWTTAGAGFTTASLAAVIYSDAASSSFGLTGYELSTSSVESTNKFAHFIRATGVNGEFKIVVDKSGSAVTKTINFDENSKKYIRNVLNTNPILTNSEIVSATADAYETYFLGETHKTWLTTNSPEVTGSTSFAGILVKLDNGTTDFGNHLVDAVDATSGWVVSQHKGTSSAFLPDYTTGEYPVQKLFRIIGLSEGSWNSQNLKVSIEDIKEPPNEYVKFGSFTVSVRKLQDNDLTPQYLERFSGLSLDPTSENYIAKKIGDKYTEWDYSKKLFAEYGTYTNQSKFIRVEMDPSVNGALTDPDLIPFGFYGPTQLATASIASATVVAGLQFRGSGSGFVAAGTILSASNSFSASFALPVLPMLSSSAESPVSSFNSIFWGLKTNVSSVKKHNKDLVDYLRDAPLSWNATKYSFMFSLDDISASVPATAQTTIRTDSPAAWIPEKIYQYGGARRQGVSLTAQNLTSSNGSRLVLSTFDKFTLPLLGGSDGLDITEKDPFNRRVLSTGTNLTNYAYNSVQVAVESIADPEVVEMNLAAMPGIDNESLTSLLIDKCEQRADAMAVVDITGDYIPDEGKATALTTAANRKPVVDTAIANLKNRAMNSSYGACFYPWVLIKDTLNNNTVWVPPSVAALGTFSSSQRKTELWFAPAGFNRGGLTEGAAGLPVVQTSLKLSSKDRDKLYEANINPIASFPSEGIVIFGQKTLQVTPSALDRINVRRLMIYLKKEISRFATTVLFDPNIQITWKRFTNKAVPFLESVKSRFGLSDFRVVLDETTTTAELVDRNIVYAKILLKPTRAIEFIALDFVITGTGASFTD